VDEVLTVRSFLDLTVKWLAQKGCESPRLDAELLAAEALGIRRLDLYLSPERPLTPTERDRLRDLVRRRAKGEPVAYLRGRREFHGIDFIVTPAVLVPRPETETIVDAALEWLAAASLDAPQVVDVGTGSGAIACAIATACPAARVLALDLSDAALEVAARNVAALGLGDRVRLDRSDLLAVLPTDAAVDIVVSNPPYVAEDERPLLDVSARDFEPALALFSGPEGTTLTARLADEAWTRLRPGGVLIVETGSPAQTSRVEALLKARFGALAVDPLPDIGRTVRGFLARKSLEGVGP
jgi:release factor glutamine methyltransferase